VPRRIAGSTAWAELRAAIQAGQAGGIDGAWGSSAAAAVSAVQLDAHGPVLVLVANVSDVASLAEDLTTFSGTRPVVFPAFETWPVIERTQLAPETTARLQVLALLNSAGMAKGLTIVAPISAVVQPVPARTELQARSRRISVGSTTDPDELVNWLNEAGYKRTEAVEAPGEFGKRGGIVDLFPSDATDPVRIEFFGDEVESLRRFAVATQRSLAKITDLTILRVNSTGAGVGWAFFTEYLPKNTLIVLLEPNDLHEAAGHFHERVAEATGLFTVQGVFANVMAHPTITVSALPRASVEATAHLTVESVERFSGQVQKVREELDTIAKRDQVYIACQTEAEVKRLTEVLSAGQLMQSDRLQLVQGHVKRGFRLILNSPLPVEGEGGRRPGEGRKKTTPHPIVASLQSTSPSRGEVEESLLILGSHELFHKELLAAGVKQITQGTRRVESRAIDSFLDLNVGDYVVHVAHGIAKYLGMKTLEKAKSEVSEFRTAQSALEEHLVLEFKDTVMLYVPASRIDLVQKYIGGTHASPPLSKLGGQAWGRKKDKITDAVRDMAAEMIQIQAVRATLPGFAFPADSDWQREFEDAFPYQETPDQASSILEIKGDLEKPRPMDRLLCGDVGYGKTEVAVRAAFKAIDNGKQVAILVPTTVLAEQHFRTFRERLAEYPFTVECLNRFRPAKEQKEIIKRLGEGSVDVVVGTHRLVSEGVKFKDLGLVIIDEEQRFGVDHKDRLKRLRTSVHILTMTATPIPRTLHGALLGIREISSLETPPLDRHPVETRIIRWDEALVRSAIYREFNRGGQVYFVHNRVFDIQEVAAKVQYLVPEAKVVIGHGQMGEGELEAAMIKFISKEANILVATTIIESGLDIPSANTIFIDDADEYGLADLHQLRGRVGRTKLRAYAYLIVQENKLVNPNAQKRLKAIEEFKELGSGFKIAMRDLEIRGAGNILGTQQSGHIAAVGYELYCQLLENAVRELKHQAPRVAVEVNVDLPWPAFLPKDYVPGQKLRIEVYRRLARLRESAKLADFKAELADRYGPLPEAVEWLMRTTEIRLLCVKWQIGGVHRVANDFIFSFRSKKKAETLEKLTNRRIKIVDDKTLYFRLKPEEDGDGNEANYRLLAKLLGVG
jgi:transcription-repair coupling factor (superfamily II helicase)